MDIMPAWLGGLLMGAGISLFLIFIEGRRITAMFFFMVFLAGVAVTYWADSGEWARATSRDRPQKEGTA